MRQCCVGVSSPERRASPKVSRQWTQAPAAREQSFAEWKPLDESLEVVSDISRSRKPSPDHLDFLIYDHTTQQTLPSASPDTLSGPRTPQSDPQTPPPFGSATETSFALPSVLDLQKSFLVADDELDATDFFGKYSRNPYPSLFADWKGRAPYWRGCLAEENLVPLVHYLFGKKYYATDARAAHDENENNTPVSAKTGTPSGGEKVGAKPAVRTWGNIFGFGGTAAVRRQDSMMYTPSSVGEDSRVGETQDALAALLEAEARGLDRPCTRVSVEMMAYDFLLFFADVGEKERRLGEGVLRNLKLRSRMTTEEATHLAGWNLGSGVSPPRPPVGSQHSEIGRPQTVTTLPLFFPHLCHRLADCWEQFASPDLPTENGDQVMDMAPVESAQYSASSANSSANSSSETSSGASSASSSPFDDEASYVARDRVRRRRRMFRVWARRQLYVLEDAMDDALFMEGQARRYAVTK